jgi:hypothetical protein
VTGKNLGANRGRRTCARIRRAPVDRAQFVGAGTAVGDRGGDAGERRKGQRAPGHRGESEQGAPVELT